MASGHNDQALLSSDLLFIARVQQSMVGVCIAIRGENVPAPPAGVPAAVIAAFYKRRGDFATQVLNNPAAFRALFANAVATDSSVVANATVNGSVALTNNNIDAQQALISDTNIDSAVAAQFNAFFSPV